MKNATMYTLAAILMLVGLFLLLLTNAGFLRPDKPYLARISGELRPVEGPLAFVHVNVVPMDREGVLEDQTVLIRNGLIESVGNAGEVTVPEHATTINGNGMYLMPGLTDMHVHIEETNELLLWVAHGVTSVRNMWGHIPSEKSRWIGAPDQLALREQIKRGELFGPTIYTAGPIMEGQPPVSPFMLVFDSPEEARASVAWQAERGYDFVKVYDHLTVETYQAILDAAEAHGLPVIGHVPLAVGLEGVLAGGQYAIEHLTGYVDPDAAEFIIPEDRLTDYAQMTRAAGVWNCPTLGVYPTTYVLPEEMKAVENKPGMAYISPRMRLMWKYLMLPGMMQSHTYEGADYRARIVEINARMTAALHDAGAGVILGTDSNNPYLIPGLSLLEELEHLVEAGFSPYEAIQAGTRNAALAMGKLDEFGTVTEGKRADLILVEENPLVDVGNVRKRAGVMVRGAWLSEAQLRKMLDELAASYTPSLLDRLWPVVILALGVALILRTVFR